MKASFDPHSCLKSLKAEFKTFRTQCRPHSRIPEHLRRAVIEAVASGLEPALVTSSLKLSPAQLNLWRQRSLPQVIANDIPRILDVIPLISGTPMPSGLRVSYEAGRLLLELSF